MFLKNNRKLLFPRLIDPIGRHSRHVDGILGNTSGHVVRPLLIFMGVHVTDKIVCANTSDRCEGEAS